MNEKTRTKLSAKLMLLLMLVLLSNGCRKETAAPDQLQSEAASGETEMYAEAGQGQSLEEPLHGYLSGKPVAGNRLTPEPGYDVVNDNAVRVRDQPSLQGTIIGQLDRGAAVTVLGRSQNRMFIDGYDSFWLKIKNGNIEGWSYGAYINLTESQYDSLPVMTADMFAGTVDLNYQRYGAPIDELIQKERETIGLQSGRFLSCSVEEYYNAIASAFEQRQSLRPFFLNSVEIGLADTDRFYILNASVLCDYIQSSYIDNISISPLAILNETTAAFIIYWFEKEPLFYLPITAMSICIRKVENANFDPLNGKTVIDDAVITRYRPESRFGGDDDMYYSFMTRGVFKTQYSFFLRMILDNVIFDWYRDED